MLNSTIYYENACTLSSGSDVSHGETCLFSEKICLKTGERSGGSTPPEGAPSKMRYNLKRHYIIIALITVVSRADRILSISCIFPLLFISLPAKMNSPEPIQKNPFIYQITVPATPVKRETRRHQNPIRFLPASIISSRISTQLTQKGLRSRISNRATLVTSPPNRL